MKKTLLLIRHGQTLFNQKDLIQGWCDSPLTKKGIQQAESAGKVLEKLQMDAAWYCSPSGRAQQTIRCITDRAYTVDSGLMEMNFGTLEGDSCSILPMDDHEAFMNFFTEYQGEGKEEVGSRIETTLKRILEQDPSDIVIAVSHGVVIHEFAVHTAGLPEDRFVWDNCAVHGISYEDGVFTYSFCLHEHCF